MQMQQHCNLTPATVEKSLIAHWKENASKLMSSTKPQSPPRQQLKPTLDEPETLKNATGTTKHPLDTRTFQICLELKRRKESVKWKIHNFFFF